MRKLIIFEDNFAKFFARKQLLESHFHIRTEVIEGASARKNPELPTTVKPSNILITYGSSITELNEEVLKRGLNRRNCLIYFFIFPDDGEEYERAFLNSCLDTRLDTSVDSYETFAQAA